MSVLQNQTNANPTTSFFAAAGSGGGGGSNLAVNSLTVSTIGNQFSYLGAASNTFRPIFFEQYAPIGSNMPKLEMKLRQRAADSGAVVSLTMGTNYKTGVSYINSAWDGYIPMPLTMSVQDLTIADETGTCMYVNNQITQVPQLSTINIQTATINGQPVGGGTVLTTSSNYSNSFTFNPGTNVSLFSYTFPSIIPAGTYQYSVPISFNTSNAAGVTSLILEVYNDASNVDSNTTCLFSQKTNDFVFYTLRGQLVSNGLSPGVVVSGTCIDSFDITVQSVSGSQTATLTKIA